MQLVKILLSTVMLLTIMSGVVVFMGANRDNKVRSLWFLLASIFSTLWATSILYVYTASPNHAEHIDLFIKLGLTSIMWADVSLFGYIAWKVEHGKMLTLLFILIFCAISIAIFLKPDLIYGQLILKNDGSGFEVKSGAFIVAYVLALALFAMALCYVSICNYIKVRKEHRKDGSLVVLTGYAIADTIVFVANLILPSYGVWGYTWLGPLSLSIVIIILYYAILRYRMLALSSIWLKIFSYIVVATSFALTYMIIFFIVFSAMFRGATPSTEVIVLNFIMILIFIALLPVTGELSSFISSLISGQNVNFTYLAKKILASSSKKANFAQLSQFICEHISADFVGFIVNGHYYPSGEATLSIESVDAIDKLAAPKNGTWAELGQNKAPWRASISGIAILRNANGDEIGKIIIGKPKAGQEFNQLDIAKIETIINLISATNKTKKKEALGVA